jgi:hypothetical protein
MSGRYSDFQSRQSLCKVCNEKNYSPRPNLFLKQHVLGESNGMSRTKRLATIQEYFRGLLPAIVAMVNERNAVNRSSTPGKLNYISVSLRKTSRNSRPELLTVAERHDHIIELHWRTPDREPQLAERTSFPRHIHFVAVMGARRFFLPQELPAIAPF